MQPFHNKVWVLSGLSLGEYCALVFAGVLSFEDGLRIVKARAEGMAAAATIGKFPSSKHCIIMIIVTLSVDVTLSLAVVDIHVDPVEALSTDLPLCLQFESHLVCRIFEHCITHTWELLLVL